MLICGGVGVDVACMIDRVRPGGDVGAGVGIDDELLVGRGVSAVVGNISDVTSLLVLTMVLFVGWAVGLKEIDGAAVCCNTMTLITETDPGLGSGPGPGPGPGFGPGPGPGSGPGFGSGPGSNGPGSNGGGSNGGGSLSTVGKLDGL